MDNEVVKELVGKILQMSNILLGSMVPAEAKRHFRSAFREALLGMIVIVDHADEKQKNHSDPANSQHNDNDSIHIIDISE